MKLAVSHFSKFPKARRIPPDPIRTMQVNNVKPTRFAIWITLFFAHVTRCTARNVVLSSLGMAVATREDNGLVSRRGRGTRHKRENLPDGIESLDDVSLDAENELLLFAISVSSRQVCSFFNERRPSLVGCAGSAIPVSPFTGISARGGTLVVSGGTGGLTIFRYDTSSGEIDPSPVVSALELDDVVGHPDVVMISSSLVALSTDFTFGFGTRLISVTEAGEVTTVGDYTIEGTTGFANAIGPANFALVSDAFSQRYLYTANGVMTAADASSPSDPASSISLPDEVESSFEAVTVSVDETTETVCYGGVTSDTEISSVVCFDISTSPLSPTFQRVFSVRGRITSLSASNGLVALVVDNTNGVRFLSL